MNRHSMSCYTKAWCLLHDFSINNNVQMCRGVDARWAQSDIPFWSTMSADCAKPSMGMCKEKPLSLRLSATRTVVGGSHSLHGYAMDGSAFDLHQCDVA
mmetsp:Transcript_9558/g.26004  ORF Transcript_9558/g.26004 Transcript_9558/m.26004 type:complete len:99 (+) Transcript_9558:245-541(+)